MHGCIKVYVAFLWLLTNVLVKFETFIKAQCIIYLQHVRNKCVVYSSTSYGDSSGSEKHVPLYIGNTDIHFLAFTCHKFDDRMHMNMSYWYGHTSIA